MVESRNQIPSKQIRLHTVTYANENLSMIALWYTGENKNWVLLKTYNGHVKSFSNMAIGEIIRIPSEAMLRSDPMTQDFVKEQAEKIRLVRKKNTLPKSKTSNNSENTAAAKANEDINADYDSVFEDNLSGQPGTQDQLYENLID